MADEINSHCLARRNFFLKKVTIFCFAGIFRVGMICTPFLLFFTRGFESLLLFLFFCWYFFYTRGGYSVFSSQKVPSFLRQDHIARSARSDAITGGKLGTPNHPPVFGQKRVISESPGLDNGEKKNFFFSNQI